MNTITRLQSFGVDEEERATLRREKISRIIRNAHYLRERILPSYGYVNFNGKQPTPSATNHIEYIQDQW